MNEWQRFMRKSLDEKLARIHADPHGARDFILADAKDADMAYGVGAPGLSPERHDGELRFRTLADYREMIRQVTRQGLVDIMLMSASTSEVLTLHERLFEKSPVTPAARANDTTDIHILRGAGYAQDASRPFRSATIDHIQCGQAECAPDQRTRGANLGLYSITFNNETELDRQSLEAFGQFRLEAERKGFRYFLEVFDPNVPGAVDPDRLPQFVNDAIARSLAGVTEAGRPLFLKIVYHGPKALEELVRYDSRLIVGILGGAAGTTYDAFKLLAEAKKYGARVALFGRKINNAENQLAFVQFLRLIADGEICPDEAVRAYHAVLQRLGVRPHRPLQEDLQLQTNVMSYAGGGRTVGLPAASRPNWRAAGASAATAAPPRQSCSCGPTCGCQETKTEKTTKAPAAAHDGSKPADTGSHSGADDAPDFARMTSEERLAYHRARLNRIFGW